MHKLSIIEEGSKSKEMSSIYSPKKANSSKRPPGAQLMLNPINESIVDVTEENEDDDVL